VEQSRDVAAEVRLPARFKGRRALKISRRHFCQWGDGEPGLLDEQHFLNGGGTLLEHRRISAQPNPTVS